MKLQKITVKLIVAMMQLIAEELVRSKNSPRGSLISEKYKSWAKFTIISKKGLKREPFGLFWT